MSTISKIDQATLHLISLPLVAPFETSFSVQTHREALLVELCAGGVRGFGECVTSADPYYGYETNTTAWHIIRDFLLPALFSLRDFEPAAAVVAFHRVRGHQMARGAVENALLDLAARQEGIPLYQLLGGQPRRILSGISIGLQPSDQAMEKVLENAVAKQYHRIKVKIKRGRDLEVLRGIRRAFPGIRLMADANSDYTLDDLPVLQAIDQFNLMMVEQPLGYDDIYQHSLLQRQLVTPVCLDESIKSLEDARTALALGSCRIINIKQGRVGGLLAAREIQALCRENHIPVWSGGMLETGIGRAFNLHLQTLPGFTLPGDTSETSRYFHEDIAGPPVTLDAEGFIALPAGPGTGMTINPGRFQACRTRQETVRPA